MTDRNGRSEGVDDALAERFGDDSDESAQTSEVEQTPTTEQTSQANNSEQAPKSNKTSKTTMSERANVMFYLSDKQAEELSLVEDQVRLEVKREFGEELEKNRHIRPLALRHGIDKLESMDATEIRDALREADDLHSPL